MTERKAVSTRTRFEVFKRDFFTCTYCGRNPPKVTLEIDHIHPVALGGDNSKSNLTTSCMECNRGKSCIPLTSVPESLASQAERIKESEKQLKAFRKIIDERESRRAADCWRVLKAIHGESTNEVPKTEYASVKVFLDRLGREECMEAAEIANFTGYERSRKFKYFCGVCWRKIKENNDGSR